MQSIAQFNPDSQCGRVIIYPLGCSIPSPLRGRKSGTGGAKEVKRGEITGFTAAARRRMRRAMLTLWIPDAQLVGITLTLPWKGDKFDCEEFRECLNRFEVAFRRQYPHSAMIFRVELQKRGAPHVHALLYLAVADTRTPRGTPARHMGCGVVRRGGVGDRRTVARRRSRPPPRKFRRL